METKEESTKEARVAYEVDRKEGDDPSGSVLEQYVVDREGNKIGVIIPFDQYQRMKEDLHDLAVVAERRGETPISLEEMKQRLRDDGLL